MLDKSTSDHGYSHHEKGVYTLLCQMLYCPPTGKWWPNQHSRKFIWVSNEFLKLSGWPNSSGRMSYLCHALGSLASLILINFEEEGCVHPSLKLVYVEWPYTIRLFQGIEYIPIGLQISCLQSHTSIGFHLVALWTRYTRATGIYTAIWQIVNGICRCELK